MAFNPGAVGSALSKSKALGGGGTTSKQKTSPVSSAGSAVKKYTPVTATPKKAVKASGSAVKSYTAPTTAKSSGGGSSYSGVGGGSFAAPAVSAPITASAPLPSPAPVAPIAPPVPTTETITIPDPLADADYKAQAASLGRQLADFRNTQQLGQRQYDTNFNEGLRKLGWQGDLHSGRFDESNLSAGTLGQALNSTTDDFAARNSIFSSGFANQMQNARNAFSDRTRQLGSDRQAFVDNQANQLSAYQNQNEEARMSAQREAVARIAAQYGVDLNQVSAGRQNTITRAI